MDSVFDKILGWVILKLMPPFLCLCIFVGIPLLLYGFYLDSKRPGFSLKKDDWVCLGHKQVKSTQYVLVGKVMVPQTFTSDECINWVKK
jgi:hypothetical protein